MVSHGDGHHELTRLGGRTGDFAGVAVHRQSLGQSGYGIGFAGIFADIRLLILFSVSPVNALSPLCVFRNRAAGNRAGIGLAKHCGIGFDGDVLHRNFFEGTDGEIDLAGTLDKVEAVVARDAECYIECALLIGRAGKDTGGIHVKTFRKSACRERIAGSSKHLIKGCKRVGTEKVRTCHGSTALERQLCIALKHISSVAVAHVMAVCGNEQNVLYHVAQPVVRSCAFRSVCYTNCGRRERIITGNVLDIGPPGLIIIGGHLEHTLAVTRIGIPTAE